MNAGGNVIDLDLIGTEVISFASSTLDVDGAAVVSASHNPKEFNGIKFVRRGAVPIAFDSGLSEISGIVTRSNLIPSGDQPGSVKRVEILEKWSEYVKKYIDKDKIKPLKIVLDPGNGMGGMMLEYLLPFLPIRVTKMFFEPNGDFPNHIPNPMLTQNLTDIIAQVKNQHADFGIAFDGDADRAIFIDEKGIPINSSIVGALIAKDVLASNHGAIILYNAVCGRIVPETTDACGGKSIRTMVGHSVIKEKMRQTGAIFAAEHSGHFYYKDYFEADSSMITMIKVLEIISSKNKPFSEITAPFDVYPQSGEINFLTPKKDEIIQNVRRSLIAFSRNFDELDGLSLWFDDWWFNLRPSQNEDLLRLNIEADSTDILLAQKKSLIDLVEFFGAKIFYPKY